MDTILEGYDDARPRKPNTINLRAKLKSNNRFLLRIVPDNRLTAVYQLLRFRVQSSIEIAHTDLILGEFWLSAPTNERYVVGSS